MPAPIISGLVTYLQNTLSITVWEGEIPRMDTSGVAITLPPGTTLFKVIMPEEGLAREWHMDRSYSDEGQMTIYVWTTSRSLTEQKLSLIEETLVSASSWAAIPVSSGPPTEPASMHEVFEMSVARWTCVHLEGLRTAASEFIYEGRLVYNVGIHGSLNSNSV